VWEQHRSGGGGAKMLDLGRVLWLNQNEALFNDKRVRLKENRNR
jgi:hypothetical protein